MGGLSVRHFLSSPPSNGVYKSFCNNLGDFWEERKTRRAKALLPSVGRGSKEQTPRRSRTSDSLTLQQLTYLRTQVKTKKNLCNAYLNQPTFAFFTCPFVSFVRSESFSLKEQTRREEERKSCSKITRSWILPKFGVSAGVKNHSPITPLIIIKHHHNLVSILTPSASI